MVSLGEILVWILNGASCGSTIVKRQLAIYIITRIRSRFEVVVVVVVQVDGSPGKEKKSVLTITFLGATHFAHDISKVKWAKMDFYLGTLLVISTVMARVLHLINFDLPSSIGFDLVLPWLMLHWNFAYYAQFFGNQFWKISIKSFKK